MRPEDLHLALDILTAQNKGKKRAAGSGFGPCSDADIKGTIVRVLISIVKA